ncbi:MAG TPA: hypothetical protein VLW50_30190 [Streptosporangiaceae bacterium]|nr:hypothetical protein [Streptosporangiaceae bacterium]
MKEIARLELGYYWPDGRRAFTVVDTEGNRHRGVLDDPDLVGEYLDYLDSLGLEPPIVTGVGPGGPAPAATQAPHPSAAPPPGPPIATAGDAGEKVFKRGESVADVAPIPMDKIGYLFATAARAPSLHNTQPWRFGVEGSALEVHADRSRLLHNSDPTGREMLISCGAALFGLRLAVRGIGYLPLVQLLPSRADYDLLARVRLGASVPMTSGERHLLAAISHRHTHRGPFNGDPLPPGMLAGLQRDAAAEGATLVLLDRPGPYQQLAELVSAAERAQNENSLMRAERRRWTRRPGSPAGDGVPVRAYAAEPAHLPGALAPRDFDLGRHWGQLEAGGASPQITAILTTMGDERADWLRAGQALHRLLVHAASRWVFASLHTQPLESAPLRAEITERLHLPGAPQMLLQFGRAGTTQVTPRRPVEEMLIEP